ncbi:MAG: thiamine pyrophosphate-dependent enzyme [Intrasporangium sp.]|uniref:thiamine pyrophosphate-dependent enzyme n=1 Tax=Intrasporangium sp. TaxID=1925024 RepID=UPI0026498B7A|nr:thiamine pyrophosphate-dependent enzyme [Intrasporangium sp.]MDN5798052.1 thiamine pyrophosphate-dependent enzyme [Intrasporangium sp.]
MSGPVGPAEVDAHFRRVVGALRAQPTRDPREPLRSDTHLTGAEALKLFDAQAGSRHLDFAARSMQARGQGFYTIGSSGHEGNAAVAAALRPGDPALLHYRSGAFYLSRAAQVSGADPIRDVLRGVAAASTEPISGGRHKVFGNHDLAVIPQTSTIGSHLPRALGVAFAIERAKRLGLESAWLPGSVVVCSFGDASANHSTVTGAVGAACHLAHQKLPLPLLFVCEDNGLGISVRSPRDWIHAAYGNRPGLCYLTADGTDLAAAYDVALEAAGHVRQERRPVFLHLRTVRLMAHAGSDVETAYRAFGDMEADLERDPLVGTARLLASAGVVSPEALLTRYEAIGAEVSCVADEVATEGHLSSAAEVMAPLAPRHADRIAAEVSRSAERPDRLAAFGGRLPEDEPPLTLAQSINRTLVDELALRPEMLVFGEDVAVKGGVYGVTRGLRRAFGTARVFDTILDEQSVLGIALGTGVSGLLPVPEIQYLAYLHNAEDQIRGEAATLSFFSAGQYTNPMVVRIAGLGYQKGFGGHFHNDNALGALRDIPGLVIAAPARPDDASAMLRTCLAAARVDGAVCVFIEPIALYHTRDLHADGDERWLAPYVPPGRWTEHHVPLGAARTHGAGDDLTIVTFGNGVRMSLRVAGELAVSGVGCRVVDLRWLAPLPVDDLLREASATGRVLVVDETRRTGGVSEGVVTALVGAGFRGRIARVASEDSFIPLGDAANLVLLSEDTILHAAHALLTRP